MRHVRHPFVMTVFSLMLLLGLGSRSVSAWIPAAASADGSETAAPEGASAFSVMTDGSGMNRPAPAQRHGLSQASLFDGAPKFHPLPFLPSLPLTDIPVGCEPDGGATIPTVVDDPLRGAIVARGP